MCLRNAAAAVRQLSRAWPHQLDYSEPVERARSGRVNGAVVLGTGDRCHALGSFSMARLLDMETPRVVPGTIKRIKRAAFGFRDFANYRIRALPYARKPNWDLHPSVTPP